MGKEEDEDMSLAVGNIQAKLELLKRKANARSNDPKLNHKISEKLADIINQNCEDLEGEQAINILKKK
ncbi:hypothetical protein [Paenibacillus elgii]|uniref:hypothetical protein n=1 Tax=Paenibacillus elgii TaxID=189691 RepID=UPI00203C6786|nr:hypothetical protein [Paenibacillus elgii]MCM3273886.1 hypothetical protein [Paenibacillus elgii]